MKSQRLATKTHWPHETGIGLHLLPGVSAIWVSATDDFEPVPEDIPAELRPDFPSRKNFLEIGPKTVQDRQGPLYEDLVVN